MNTTGRYTIAGYLTDVLQIAAFRFSNPHSLIKFLQIDTLRKRTGARQFIEAGTYLGLMAERCGRVCEKVYTIELDPILVRKAAARLAKCSNIELVEGDAAQRLVEILHRFEVQDVVIFWDDHACSAYSQSGVKPEGGEGNTDAVITALSRITGYSHKAKGIVVDDFRLFGEQQGFPSKTELIGFLEQFGGGAFEVRVHLDQVVLARKPVATAPAATLH